MILLSIAGVTGKSTDRVINALLTAQDRLAIAEASLKKIDRSIADGTTMDDSDFVIREDTAKAVDDARRLVAKHSTALGTNSLEALTLEANKEYFNARRKARAKRDMWMKRLQERRRELDNIERPHMSEINSK